MAQTYTLEEAAGRLALPTEEFKRRLKDDWKQIRSFRDGATLRFRAADIDELARMMGEMSDPGLQLGPVGAEAHDAPDTSEDFLLTDDAPEGAGPGSGLFKPADLGGDTEFVLPTGKSGTKVGKPKPNLKPPSDSDIRLEPPAASKPHSDDLSLPTEEISLDLSGPGSAIIKPSQSGKLSPPKSGAGAKLPPPKPSAKLTGPMSGKFPAAPLTGKYTPGGPPSAKIPGPGSSLSGHNDSSEFELSLDADSDSFDLKLNDGDDSAEMDLGSLELGPPNQDHGGLSGINLGKPADSGLSLEAAPRKSGPLPMGGPKSSKIIPKSGGKKKEPEPVASDESDVDFELSVDSGSAGPKSQKYSKDSDSEFELTLDDEGTSATDLASPKTAAGSASRGAENIQETDFELPAMGEDEESGSEVVAVDEDSSSDFDLAINEEDVEPDQDESASQVMLVDDEPLIDEDGSEVLIDEGDAMADVEVEEGASASGALAGVRAEEDEDEDVPVRTVAAAPAKWGVLPAIVLLPSLLLVCLGGLMSFELVRGMWGYHQPSKPSSMILRAMADNLDMKVND